MGDAQAQYDRARRRPKMFDLRVRLCEAAACQGHREAIFELSQLLLHAAYEPSDDRLHYRTPQYKEQGMHVWRSHDQAGGGTDIGHERAKSISQLAELDRTLVL